MLLKTMTMDNFRQFKGKTRIVFSSDKEKNVTIILGDNTYGKTTLLQAFSWCLYETVLFDTNPNFLLNLELSEAMNEDDETNVDVEIELLHNGVEYVITRSQKYICKNNYVRPLTAVPRVSYKQTDGQTEAIKTSEIKRVIDNILPKDLSSYFFFDTERVGSISSSRDVADAVKGLLGLTAMENAIKHLGKKETKTSVIGKFYASMDLEGDARAQEALSRIQDAENRCSVIAEQLENCENELSYYNAQKEQLEAVLRDNQTTSSLQKRADRLARDVRMETDAQARVIKGLLSEFNASSAHYYATPLLKQASQFLQEVKIDDKGIKDLTRPTIDDIVKRGTCICGAELSEGSEALKHLIELIHYVPPESIGNTVRIYKERLVSFDSASDRIFESMKTRYEEYLRSKTRIQEWNDELVDIEAQIKGKESMEKYSQQLSDVKNRLKEQNAKKDRLNREDAVHKKEIETYRKAYDSLVTKTGKNKAIMQHIVYAEQIRDWLAESYKQNELDIREELETHVNEIFSRMYHGHRRVVLDGKYQVTLLSTIADKEIATGESEGSNRVKNFAFISGLVAMAKARSISRAEDASIAASEPYPLVMDAPFSNADETHTANISKILPEVAEQVVMFVMQKDWRYAEPSMGSRVGKSYILDKQSETHTILKEV